MIVEIPNEFEKMSDQVIMVGGVRMDVHATEERPTGKFELRGRLLALAEQRANILAMYAASMDRMGPTCEASSVSYKALMPSTRMTHPTTAMPTNSAPHSMAALAAISYGTVGGVHAVAPPVEQTWSMTRRTTTHGAAAMADLYDILSKHDGRFEIHRELIARDLKRKRFWADERTA